LRRGGADAGAERAEPPWLASAEVFISDFGSRPAACADDTGATVSPDDPWLVSWAWSGRWRPVATTLVRGRSLPLVFFRIDHHPFNVFVPAAQYCSIQSRQRLGSAGKPRSRPRRHFNGKWRQSKAFEIRNGVGQIGALLQNDVYSRPRSK
jgi:hypothetical protein